MAIVRKANLRKKSVVGGSKFSKLEGGRKKKERLFYLSFLSRHLKFRLLLEADRKLKLVPSNHGDIEQSKKLYWRQLV